MKVKLDGKKTNLRNLENKIIRAKYEDPRIHAALNCASISCPRLPREPYTPDKLESQLQSSIEEFVIDENNVRVDSAKKAVYLSEIFDWFSKDFIEFEKSQGIKRPSLVDYVNRYRPVDQKIDKSFKIKFIKYDKGVNQV